MRETTLRFLHWAPLAALGLVFATACGESNSPTEETIGSPTAKPEIPRSLREDLTLPRHPSDGAGKAWLEPLEDEPQAVPAGGEGRWRIVFEVGPLGIAEGGGVYLQVSPFWGWSTPQTVDPALPGWTEVTTTNSEVALDVRTADQQLLYVGVREGSFEPGDQIRFDYGAGERGSRADRYAETGSRFWIAVDGDGDGVRKVLNNPVTTDVLPGPPRRLIVTVPSIVRPGGTAQLRLAFLDRGGNAGIPYRGTVDLRAVAVACESPLCQQEGTVDLPATVRLEPDLQGMVAIDFVAPEQGVYRVQATTGQGSDAMRGSSNLLVVSTEWPLIRWADLHGHSQLSDGTGTPDEYFRYARDAAGLDAVSLTDHDHWGIQPLAVHPTVWDLIRRTSDEYHEPGRFVTVLGYEWTSWIYGHRHVLYFDNEGEILSSVDPAFEHPEQLWAALRGRDAMTFAHHSAGGPVATDWSIPPDPELEPMTEVASVHGSSEAPDSPHPIYQAVADNWVRDALGMGYELGLIGSGDSHDGHPGLAHLVSGLGGLAGIYAAELTRPSLLAALRHRNAFATSGPRIALRVTLDGHTAGNKLAPRGESTLAIRALGTGPIARVDVVRDGVVAPLWSTTDELEDLWVYDQTASVGELADGSYLYVRIVQEDGHAAWSSPFFVRQDGHR